MFKFNSTLQKSLKIPKTNIGILKNVEKVIVGITRMLKIPTTERRLVITGNVT